MLKLIALWTAVLSSAVLADSQTVRLADRSYVIDLPADPFGAPVIVALHGGGGNPAQFARNSGLSRPANAQGFAVVYPAGTGLERLQRLAWNGGYCCGAAARDGVEDIAFLDAVIADATSRFGLDPARIYMTGMSNGGLMTEVYAAARPGRLQAAASVSGSMDVAHTKVGGPVPMLIIHGTLDPRVPFDGGVGRDGTKAVNWSSVPQVVAAFVRAAGGSLAVTTRVVDPAEDGMRVRWSDHTTATGRVMVRLLAIEGGGHVWPGGRRAAREGGTRDIDANTEVLRFFGAHR